MCGIVGYIEAATEILLAGLEKLSTGAMIPPESPRSARERFTASAKGNSTICEKTTTHRKPVSDWDYTRWATHGKGGVQRPSAYRY